MKINKMDIKIMKRALLITLIRFLYVLCIGAHIIPPRTYVQVLFKLYSNICSLSRTKSNNLQKTEHLFEVSESLCYNITKIENEVYANA